MTRRDGFSNFKFFQAIPPQIADADVTGEGVDTQGYNTTTFLLNIGGLSNLSGASYWVFYMEHTDASALGVGPSDYAIVASADVIRHESAAMTSGIVLSLYISTLESAVYPIGYIGTKRYCRVVFEEKANLSTAAIGVVCVQGLPGIAPVNVPNVG